MPFAASHPRLSVRPALPFCKPLHYPGRCDEETFRPRIDIASAPCHAPVRRPQERLCQNQNPTFFKAPST